MDVCTGCIGGVVGGALVVPSSAGDVEGVGVCGGVCGTSIGPGSRWSINGMPLGPLLAFPSSRDVGGLDVCVGGTWGVCLGVLASILFSTSSHMSRTAAVIPSTSDAVSGPAAFLCFPLPLCRTDRVDMSGSS